MDKRSAITVFEQSLKYCVAFIIIVVISSCDMNRCELDDDYAAHLEIISASVEKNHGGLTGEAIESIMYLSDLTGIESLVNFGETVYYSKIRDFKKDKKKWIAWYRNNGCSFGEIVDASTTPPYRLKKSDINVVLDPNLRPKGFDNGTLILVYQISDTGLLTGINLKKLTLRDSLEYEILDYYNESNKLMAMHDYPPEVQPYIKFMEEEALKRDIVKIDSLAADQSCLLALLLRLGKDMP